MAKKSIKQVEQPREHNKASKIKVSLSINPIFDKHMNFLILNGPNLNLLGKREPEIYGRSSFDEFFATLQHQFPEHAISYVQSNHEGDLIDQLHQHGFDMDGIVINAGAYTHTSIALADAIRSITSPVIEVHLSNVFKRETYRHHSFISEACLGVIAGFGMHSYVLAIQALILKKQTSLP
jgi:3-dehydroquinate dehydratase-2